MLIEKIAERLREIATDVHDKIEGVHERIHDQVEDVKEHIEEHLENRLTENLDELAKGKPYKNWRRSAEDFAYLVGEDGSYEGRKELWAECGLEGKFEGKPDQNELLRKTMFEALARPPYNIPLP